MAFLVSILPIHLLYAVLLFCTAIAVLILFMLFTLVRRNKRQLRRKKLYADMQDWIGMIVLDEEKLPNTPFEIPEDIAVLLKKRFNRRVVMRLLVDLKRQISGSAGDNLVRLYMQLRLSETSLHKLDSRFWHVVIRGIQELSIMEQVEHSERIFKLTNNHNKYIRMEAQTALVKLYSYKGLSFLDTLSQPMSDWQQLMLTDLLQHHPIQLAPDLEPWLQSQNNSVVTLALKLVASLQDQRYEEQVRKLLHHDCGQVRMAALHAFRELAMGWEINELERCFLSSGKRMQVAIVRMIESASQEVPTSLIITLQQTNDAEVKFLLQRLLEGRKRMVNPSHEESFKAIA